MIQLNSSKESAVFQRENSDAHLFETSFHQSFSIFRWLQPTFVLGHFFFFFVIYPKLCVRFVESLFFFITTIWPILW